MECAVPEFCRLDQPVARKDHRCIECRAPILKGEPHLHVVGKWEGTIESFRQHLDCCAACELIRDELNDGECVCFGGLKDWCGEYRIDIREGARTPGKSREACKQLRSLLARIKWRERPYRQKRR